MIVIASFVHSSSNSSDSQPSKHGIESRKRCSSGEVVGGGGGAEQSMDEEAELLVELMIDDVEVGCSPSGEPPLLRFPRESK